MYRSRTILRNSHGNIVGVYKFSRKSPKIFGNRLEKLWLPSGKSTEISLGNRAGVSSGVDNIFVGHFLRSNRFIFTGFFFLVQNPLRIRENDLGPKKNLPILIPRLSSNLKAAENKHEPKSSQS